MNSNRLSIKLLSLLSGLLSVFFFVLISACGTAPSGEDANKNADSTKNEINEDTLAKVKKVFYSLPTPNETAMLIKRAGAKYHEDLLNPVDNASKYISTKSRAINLGVYISDLSYASIFNKAQTSIKYMNNARKLAEALGVPDAINQDLIDRLEKSKNNKNEVMSIIAETFMNSNSVLSPETATMVVIGGWIEGMYIATQLVNKKDLKDNELANRIIDQQLTLTIVIDLVKKFPNNNDIVNLAKDINDLSALYAKIPAASQNVTVTQDDKTNEAVLESPIPAAIPPDVFLQLCDKITAIRASYIQ